MGDWMWILGLGDSLVFFACAALWLFACGVGLCLILLPAWRLFVCAFLVLAFSFS
jgi:hypothetical protein